MGNSILPCSGNEAICTSETQNASFNLSEMYERRENNFKLKVLVLFSCSYFAEALKGQVSVFFIVCSGTGTFRFIACAGTSNNLGKKEIFPKMKKKKGMFVPEQCLISKLPVPFRSGTDNFLLIVCSGADGGFKIVSSGVSSVCSGTDSV